MSEMTPGVHARTKTARTPGLGAAWAVLIGTGVTSVTYNVVHATQGAHLEVALALLLAWAPAFVSACLSHLAAVMDAPWPVKTAVIAVTLAGMVLSASATAAVVQPAEPGWRGWLFGITLDAAALLALWAILTARKRKDEAAMAVEAAHAEAETARTAVREATRERSQMEAELASARASAAAELDTVKAELGSQLAAVTAELEAARGALLRRGPAKRSKAVRTVPRTAPEDDLALEARALDLLATDLNMSGAELARKLDVSPSYGRKLRRRLTAPDRPVDRLGAPVQEHPQERSQDR